MIELCHSDKVSKERKFVISISEFLADKNYNVPYIG